MLIRSFLEAITGIGEGCHYFFRYLQIGLNEKPDAQEKN